jgi:membrane protein DedA with SNARE-associated domain
VRDFTSYLLVSRFRLVTSYIGWQSLSHLGGPGLILFGIIDQSFVPVPGGMDALTIVLAAGQPDRWPYFAVMSTIGTVIGAYITYAISRKGGKEALKKRLLPRQIKKIESKFKEHGFSAVFVPCLLPPPLPAVPFLVGAGALQYPKRRFLLAVTSGRLLRYMVIAYLGHLYGDAILGFFKRYELVIIIVFVVLMVGATLGGFLYRKWQLKREGGDEREENEDKDAAAPTEIPDPGLQRTKPLPPIEIDTRKRRIG